jgi:hypothetical protein
VSQKWPLVSLFPSTRKRGSGQPENAWVNSQTPANGTSEMIQRGPHKGNVGF